MVIFGAGRAVSRSSRARAVLVGRGGGGGISAVPLQGANRDGGSIGRIKENLGFLRGYLSSIGANRGGGGFVSKACLLDWNRRLFSNSENFHSKQENGNTTGNEQNSQSNGDETYEEIIRKKSFALLLGIVNYTLYSSLNKDYYEDYYEPQPITFEEFKTRLLEPGLVDYVLVFNKLESKKSVAKVYVRREVEEPGSGIPVRTNKSQYRYYFNIESVKSFEDKMQESQEALGIDPNDNVPIVYKYDAWLYVMPFLVLGLGSFLRRKVGRNIFMGKANITKVDKNA